MCVVSMVTEHYIDKWSGIGVTHTLPNITVIPPTSQNIPNWMIKTPSISPEEVAEFKALLERAREYDRKNNEPLCELEEKKETLRRIAKQLGVDINFL